MKYIITFVATVYTEIEVEGSSLKDAIQKANKMDQDSFSPDEEIEYWSIDIEATKRNNNIGD